MIVIPGHGAVGDKSQRAFYRDLLVGARERAASKMSYERVSEWFLD
jgi:hypothetical protein